MIKVFCASVKGSGTSMFKNFITYSKAPGVLLFISSYKEISIYICYYNYVPFYSFIYKPNLFV